MRPISEATLAILKSQNLTGQDKFNYDLKLEGYQGGYGDIESSVLKSNANVNWLDFEITSNGKVLVAYKLNLGIYLLTLSSLDLLLSTDNVITGGTLFYTLAGSEENQCFALKRLSNGEILFFIADNGSYANSIPMSTKCYASINGLGTDFVLRSTIDTWIRLGATSNYDKNFVTKPAQLADGSLILSAPKYASYSGYDQSQYSVYKSTDNGITWTLKYNNTHRYYTLSGSMYGDVTCVGDNVFCTVRVNQFGYIGMFLLSTDKGETWTMYAQAFSNFPSNSDYNKYAVITYNPYENKLYLVIQGEVTLRFMDIYQSIDVPDVITNTWINTLSNWNKIADYVQGDDEWCRLYALHDGKIILTYAHVSDPIVYIRGYNRTLYSALFPAASISISKGRGGANTASIQASNLNGSLNPKNPDSPLYGIIGTNKQVIIKQGYGDDLIETFTGLIDGFEMATWPQTTNISLRDKLKKALDQTVTYGTQHTIHFELQAIENIVGYLCYLAGIETGDIETTGIQVAKTFSWESYADCFQFLGDLASFEWGCDEYGKFYFRRDYQPDDMYVAYTFEEGVDISALKYTIKDDDLYYKVAVFGKSGDTVISYEAPFLDAGAYNIMPQKILKIDATEATTMGELQKIAERAIALMQSRTAVVNFTAVAVPWLQVGDFIGVYERSTGAASIYRISSLNLDMDSDSFTMSIDAYYYGDSIVPGELPTDTATQTVAPSTNLIPEMTANTAPSGVARASSVYTSAYEPWQAFNSTDEDLYWNAITNTGWIEYQFPEKMIVDKYSLKARQAIEYNDAMPMAWTFEGFDGSAWVVLDTRSAQTAWGISEVRTYLFTNTTAYSKYRLNVSANNGYNRLQLEQLAMYYGGGS